MKSKNTELEVRIESLESECRKIWSNECNHYSTLKENQEKIIRIMPKPIHYLFLFVTMIASIRSCCYSRDAYNNTCNIQSQIEARQTYEEAR